MKAVILTIVMIILSLTLAGCIYETPDSSWEELIDSYDEDKKEFVGYDLGEVRVDGTVDTIENYNGMTELTLESKPDIEVYLTETVEHEPDDGYLTRYYDSGDYIDFRVTIKEDDYGEYIDELEP